MFFLGFKTTDRVEFLVLAATIRFTFPTFAAAQDTAGDISQPCSASGAGWRTDTTGQDGQIVVRSQMQLLF